MTKNPHTAPPAVGNTSAQADHQPDAAPRHVTYLTTGKGDRFGARGRFVSVEDGFTHDELVAGVEAEELAKPTPKQLGMHRRT